MAKFIASKFTGKAKSVKEMSAEDRMKMRAAKRFKIGGQVPSAYSKAD